MTFSDEAGQYGPGHNTFTVSEDGSEDILVYHARQEEKYISGSYEPLYDAGRHTRVQKLFWNSDGTPNFGSPFADGKVQSEVKVKATIIVETVNDEVIGDFNGDKAVDSIDFAVLKQYLLGMREGFDVKDAMYVGDLNRDSEINAIDLAILKGYLLGVYSKLPYER